jgi:hypothetical protein
LAIASSLMATHPRSQGLLAGEHRKPGPVR